VNETAQTKSSVGEAFVKPGEGTAAGKWEVYLHGPSGDEYASGAFDSREEAQAEADRMNNVKIAQQKYLYPEKEFQYEAPPHQEPVLEAVMDGDVDTGKKELTDLGDEVRKALEEEIEYLANVDAAMAWSTPGDDMEGYGKDVEEVWIEAEFGDALAINGDPVIKGEQEPKMPKGFELSDQGGRIPTTEQEIPLETLVGSVAQRLGVSEDAVQEVADWVGYKQYVYASVSGDSDIYVKRKGKEPSEDVSKVTAARQFIHEITQADVGQSHLKAPDGRVIPTSSFMGKILPKDVGKHIYLVDGTLQVENDEQLAARQSQAKTAQAEDTDLLRDVDVGGFRLQMWDTGRQDSYGKTRIRYKFSAPDGKVLFEGDDFRSSPMHGIDSDEAVRALLGFLTLRPGDTDEEYFKDYTKEQMDFAEQHGENLSMYSMDPADMGGDFEAEPLPDWTGPKKDPEDVGKKTAKRTAQRMTQPGSYSWANSEGVPGEGNMEIGEVPIPKGSKVVRKLSGDVYEVALPDGKKVYAPAKRTAQTAYKGITDLKKGLGLEPGKELPSYVWPGGYPVYYITADGGALCPKCANENAEQEDDPNDPQWFLIAQEANWEDENLFCDACSAHIESAYGDDEEAPPTEDVGKKTAQKDENFCKVCGGSGMKHPPNPEPCVRCGGTGREPVKKAALVEENEDVWGSEEGSPECPACGGPGVALGSLGNRAHFRCRNCGMDFSHEDAKGSEPWREMQVEKSERGFMASYKGKTISASADDMGAFWTIQENGATIQAGQATSVPEAKKAVRAILGIKEVACKMVKRKKKVKSKAIEVPADGKVREVHLEASGTAPLPLETFTLDEKGGLKKEFAVGARVAMKDGRFGTVKAVAPEGQKFVKGEAEAQVLIEVDGEKDLTPAPSHDVLVSADSVSNPSPA